MSTVLEKMVELSPLCHQLKELTNRLNQVGFFNRDEKFKRSFREKIKSKYEIFKYDSDLFLSKSNSYVRFFISGILPFETNYIFIFENRIRCARSDTFVDLTVEELTDCDFNYLYLCDSTNILKSKFINPINGGKYVSF